MTTLPAMLMKFSGQIQLGEETMSSSFFIIFFELTIRKLKFGYGIMKPHVNILGVLRNK